MTRRPLVLLFVATACTPATPKDFCIQQIELSCSKTFECAKTDAEKRILQLLWANEGECVASQKGSCDNFKLCTGPGQSWDREAGGRCLSETAVTTCEMLKTGDIPPRPSCSQLCSRSP